MKRAVKIADGLLQRERGGVSFKGQPEGHEVFFAGVKMRCGGWLVPRNAAFQLFGCIYIGRRWLRDGFQLRNFAHEYGHYLQERRLGHLSYLYRIALPSVWSLMRSPQHHARQPFEAEATSLGAAYLNEHIQKNNHKP